MIRLEGLGWTMGDAADKPPSDGPGARAVGSAMARITEAIALLQGGDRGEARERFATIWTEIAAEPDPFAECVLAHYMADTQDDVIGELTWDLRALHAADRVTQTRAAMHHPTLSIAAFYPSLYLNVADDYFRLGDFASARCFLDSGRSCLDSLPDTGLAGMIRAGLDRLAARLHADDPSGRAATCSSSSRSGRP